MKKITNKQLLSFVIVLIGILSLFGGTSYAILKGSTTANNEQIIKSGSVELKLTENYESIDKKIMVMSDSNGLLQSDVYEFNIKNIGASAAKYDLKLTNEAPGDFTGNLLSSEYIKIGLEINGEEFGPMSLSEVNSVIDKNTIYPNEVIVYKLRIWLDSSKETELATMTDYKAFFKLGVEAEQRVDSNLDTSGANKPVLSENMIPVYYDETAEVWKKADSNNRHSSYKWYNYDEKMWANSVTVSSTNRSTYLSASLGTEIPMDDILTMQVWVPRYKYKVWNYNADGTAKSSPQEIKITFEKGTATTGEISCSDSISGTDGAVSETCKLKSDNLACTDSTCNGKTYTHPAFTFGTEQLEGIWVGKFETTGTISDITIKPDLSSLRNQNVSAFESNIMAMNDSGNKFGFATTVDTHMMKNQEWGAVAYLSHSKYGINKEININNSSSFYTGRSGGHVGGQTPINGTYTDQTSTTQYNSYGFYTYDGYLLNYNTNTKSSTKDMTKIASTTGNIYGIYDMSGGAYEYVMGNIVSNDGTTMMSGYSTSINSGYTGIIYDSGSYTSYTGISYPENKYLDKYSFGTSSTQRIRSKLGDALKEVYNTENYGWYTDGSYLAYSSFPWIRRGGYYSSGSIAGVFYSDSSSGDNSKSSSRLVITP